MRKSYVVVLSPEDREHLEKLISTARTSSKRQIQARILLKADASEVRAAWSDEQIAEALRSVSPLSLA
jgi:guanylate kinase